MSDSKLQGTQMKKGKVSPLLYKAFLARSQGPAVSNTALAMIFEEWRPSFEVQKYLVQKYQRRCFEKALQIIADDCKTVLSVNTTSKIIDLAPGRVSGRIILLLTKILTVSSHLHSMGKHKATRGDRL
jgi:hypothetical protein